MAEVHLDHPDETRWFNGWGPAPVLGECPHTGCPHEKTAAIAYGPDYAHYVLDVCNEPDGCNGECRGWFGEWPVGHVPRYRPPQQWLHVPPSQPVTTATRPEPVSPCVDCGAPSTPPCAINDEPYCRDCWDSHAPFDDEDE